MEASQGAGCAEKQRNWRKQNVAVSGFVMMKINTFLEANRRIEIATSLRSSQ
jgi:hypothetical protein